MSEREHLLVVALALSLVAGKPAQARTWTDASGQGQVEADFIAFQADKVWLHRADGRDLGSCVLDNVMAFDFEDMFSFESGGKSYLVLCDVGNNVRASTVQIMYMIEEPPIGADDRVAVSKVPVVETINFSYEDDHRDCEAVGVDPTTKTILFVTRERGRSCYVYALPWPPHVPNKAFVARKIATLKIPATTAMDISSDGRRAVVLTYGNAYEYVRGANEDWSEGFSRPPREIIVPVRIQGESICYGADDKTLYLTSEKRPTPLLEIPVIDSP